MFLLKILVANVFIFLFLNDAMASQTVTLSDSFSCKKERDKKQFRLSPYGSYLVCGGTQGSEYQVKVLSILDKPGQVNAFDIPFEKELIGGIEITEIGSDEKFTLMTRYSRVDGIEGTQSRLFLGNNSNGQVTQVADTLPAGCSIKGAAMSPNAKSLVYAVSGVTFKVDYNTLTSSFHGCPKKHVGYYHYNVATAQFRRLSDRVDETMITHAPLITADSKAAIITSGSDLHLISVGLPTGQPVIELAKETRKNDLGILGAFWRLDFAGPNHLFGALKRTSKYDDVPDGYVAQVLAIAPLNGGKVTELSMGLMPEDKQGVVQIWPRSSPNGKWFTFGMAEGKEPEGFYAVSNQSSELLMLSPELLYGGEHTPDSSGVVFEHEDRMYYAPFDGSGVTMYNTKLDYYDNKVATNARHNLVKFAAGRTYFLADNLSDNCGRGWAGLYSVPIKGGKVEPVMPPFTENCEVFDYTFSKDLKDIIYISSDGQNRGYKFHKAEIADHRLQVELWGF